MIHVKRFAWRGLNFQVHSIMTNYSSRRVIESSTHQAILHHYMSYLACFLISIQSSNLITVMIKIHTNTICAKLIRQF